MACFASLYSQSEFCVKRSSSSMAMSYSFCLATRSSSSNLQTIRIKDKMEDYGLDSLILCCGSLDKLICSVAYFLRVAGRALARNKSLYSSSIEISANEFSDAFIFIIAWEQRCRLVQKEVLKLVPVLKKIELINYRFAVEHVVLGGRNQNFPVGFGTCQSSLLFHMEYWLILLF